jgi:hypothetical protein
VNAVRSQLGAASQTEALQLSITDYPKKQPYASFLISVNNLIAYGFLRLMAVRFQQSSLIELRSLK